MRYYIDCEFDGHNGPLLSMAMVPEEGGGLHYKVTDAPDIGDPWVAENVVPILDSHHAHWDHVGEVNSLSYALRQLIGSDPHPTIVADSPVDIGRFCKAISTGGDGGWASADYPQMTFEVHNVDCYPTDLPGAVQHNAYWDALALKYKLTGGQ